VPWRHALALVDLLESADIELTLIKDGDHRLSETGDLQRLTRTIAALVVGTHGESTSDFSPSR